ncbi:hypothetical protein D3C87_229070 [compost metagenome]
MKHLFHLFLISIVPFTSFGQIIIGGNNPNDFISTALSSPNVSISNVSYTGYNGAICYFSANVQNMPFTSGLLMTTGAVHLAKGPNNDPSIYLDNSFPGYSPLNTTLGGVSTHNAAVISFDVVPNGDTLKIRYILGSEEYPEYVGSQFVDGMAIYISGPGISGTQNIARLPDGIIISVNNVNNGTYGPAPGVIPIGPVNPQYFAANGNGNQAPYNTSDSYLQYDGLTVPLIAKSKVTPNETYHIVIAIADAGDGIFDSGVFIEEGGITAGLGESNLDNFVSVFYDPSNQQAIIQVTEHQDNLTYSVVDLSGKTIVNSPITETTTLDLSNYSSGMYLITVESANGKISKKIIR